MGALPFKPHVSKEYYYYLLSDKMVSRLFVDARTPAPMFGAIRQIMYGFNNMVVKDLRRGFGLISFGKEIKMGFGPGKYKRRNPYILLYKYRTNRIE